MSKFDRDHLGGGTDRNPRLKITATDALTRASIWRFHKITLGIMAQAKSVRIAVIEMM